ncbi:MAG: ChuX/HutX family heme-like substrate-binding protein [Rhizobiaceae bacterium]|jgi:putative hemin transport protein
MDQHTKPSPQAIVRARVDNPKMRERDLATQLGISEAELVAAHCGDGVLRIEPRVNDLLVGLGAVGEVMALTRNESVVHEKIGVYENVEPGEHAALVLGEQIDLRVFPKAWKYGFAVEKRDGDDIRRSLQFFDASGEAVHKVHLRAASNLYAYQKLVSELESTGQSRTLDVVPLPGEDAGTSETSASVEDLRDRWSRMTDVHQFFGILKALKLNRRQAMRMVGKDYAWSMPVDSVAAVLSHAAQQALPIMCFVGNRGCIQIHSGPVQSIKPMGPWINVMDETFHMHLRADHIAEVWGVRKPNTDGHVTSVEAYDAAGRLIIQFFGKREEGQHEREDWRFLVENMPRIDSPVAA